MLRHFAVAGFLIEALATTPLSGQHAGVPLERWDASSISLGPGVPGTGAERDTVLAPRRDYRYEGLLIGGLAVGAAGALVGSQISGPCALSSGNSCHNDKVGTAVGLGLLSAALGGGLGYLIGRLSPKLPARDILLPARPWRAVGVPDSVRQRVGYQHWRGGALGVAIGGAVGMVTGALLLNGHCDDCSHQSDGALVVGLVGAGTGGVLGFVAGLASPKYQMVPSPNPEP